MAPTILSPLPCADIGFLAAEEAIETLPLWEVVAYQGLFQPGNTYYVHAASKYHAECLASEQLAPAEWFPTFSARRRAPDTPSELLLPTAIHQ